MGGPVRATVLSSILFSKKKRNPPTNPSSPTLTCEGQGTRNKLAVNAVFLKTDLVFDDISKVWIPFLEDESRNIYVRFRNSTVLLIQ